MNDKNGNTTSETVGTSTTTFNWVAKGLNSCPPSAYGDSPRRDFENRLTSVALPGTGGTVSFKYDPFGRRIYKSSSSGTTIFAYDGDNMVEQLNSSGTATARYTQGLGIDEPLEIYEGGKSYYYHADGLGSIVALTKSTGTAANTYFGYNTFGGMPNPSETVSNPFRFTAREWDSETGLYYYRARYYDSLFGRFLKEDPARVSGDINFYRYAFDNPTNLKDPKGLAACQSGLCADCPKGRWVGGAFAGEGGVQFGPIGGGAFVFTGIFICTSNPTFNVPFYTVCGYAAAIKKFRGPKGKAGAKGLGGSAAVGPAAVTCTGIKCREGLAGAEGGYFGQVGPGYAFRENVGGGGSCWGLGAAIGVPLEVEGGGFGCKTYIADSSASWGGVY